MLISPFFLPMDFTEVWTQTEAVDTCPQNLKNAEHNCIILLLISTVLLLFNVLTVLFFNRSVILEMYRTRFQRLPQSETASSVFRGAAFDHDTFDLKG
uniref:Uncharacterized protein n=2 Tax=Caenorhabditis japonica TaxID=281687 RepID=A0A8R1HQR2_CAEJA